MGGFAGDSTPKIEVNYGKSSTQTVSNTQITNDWNYEPPKF